MSLPENPIASLLRGAMVEAQQESAHAAATLVAVACGYLLPHVTQTDVEEGVVFLDFHSPWRRLNGKRLPTWEQTQALRRVRQALRNYYTRFPKPAFPVMVLYNCPRCTKGGLCQEMLEEGHKQEWLKRVQDAIDRRGWVAGMLDLLPFGTATVPVIVVHGYLIDKQTAKPITAQEFQVFAEEFGKLVPGQLCLEVRRCERCQKGKQIKTDFCTEAGGPPDPTQPAGDDNQSFAA